MTARQFAAHIGKSHKWVLGMCRLERIPDAQKLPVGWIIPVDAKVYVPEIDMLLPQELALDVEPGEEPVYGQRHVQQYNQRVSVELPGFKRVQSELGLSVRDVSNMTGLSTQTVQNARNRRVYPKSARKLAKGLNVEVEELLRRK